MFRYMPTVCPVCKEKLGKKLKTELYIVACVECRVKWLWEPNKELPVPMLDEKNNKCECEGCKYRDSH